MERRRLGQTDLWVSPIIFGAMDRSPDGDTARATEILHAGLDAGITAVDTAPLYGFGASERWLGSALKGKEVVVLTKVGLRWDDPWGEVMFETDGPEGRLQVRKNGRPASIRYEVEQSLIRLAVETLDVVQIHQPDLQTPVAETIGALLDLKKEGKLRAIGVSNFTPELMTAARSALGDEPLACTQPPYSLLDRDIEHDVLPYARSKEIAVVTYSPLAEGLLSGKIGPDRAITDYRNLNPRFSVENRRRILNTLETVVAPIARTHDAAVSEVCLAWLLHTPGMTAVIAGASRPAHASSAAQAGELMLSKEERAQIGQAFDGLELAGMTPALHARARRLVGRVVRKGPKVLRSWLGRSP